MPRSRKLSLEIKYDDEYVNYLRKLGRRPGETLLGFEKRLAAVGRARHVILFLWKKHNGDMRLIAEEIGTPRQALDKEFKLCGFTLKLLKELYPTKL